MSKELLNLKAKKMLQDILKVDSLDEKLGINYDNFRKVPGEKNTFRITADKISLTGLIYLIEHEDIEDVYFHPSVAPPRDGITSVAMRYHLYVIYR